MWVGYRHRHAPERQIQRQRLARVIFYTSVKATPLHMNSNTVSTRAPQKVSLFLIRWWQSGGRVLRRMAQQGLRWIKPRLNLLGEATVTNCREIVAEYRATKIKADRYNGDVCFLLGELVDWVDEEEKRLGRELTDAEIDSERKDLVAIHKKVEEHIEATRVPFAELAAWITEEEERLHVVLTEDEIEEKRDELMAKYGVKRYNRF